MDAWDIWGLGGSPEYFAGGGDPYNLPLLSIGAAAPALSGINTSEMGPWGAVATIGSAIGNALFAPRQENPLGEIMKQVPWLFPQDQLTTPQVSVNALPARCATTAGMSGLPCVVHQSGPYKGQMVRSSRKRTIKLVRQPDGSLTPVICCKRPTMNPLNPRALSRAARRLAKFQHIAKGIDAMINRQICSKARRSHSRGYVPRGPSRGCFPRRGCR